VNLGRLRSSPAGSGGRRHAEPPHPYRNEFQRDRDRIVHARAFRRLEDKTQVFGAGLSDHFRNRLTHTIEVAQIARTAAAALSLDEDFTEALALAHDIGHPPFAHAGEEALHRCLAPFGETFDHNLHALRIVERFESRYARFPGLNLTFAVREGMVKHSRDFAPREFPELDEYFPGLRPPLEAQLIDLADECAYNTADLDDGFSAGLFAMEEIAAAVPQYGALLAGIDRRFPRADVQVRFQEVLRNLVDLLVSGLIEGTAAAAGAAQAGTLDDVRRCPRRLAALTPEAAEAGAGLKRFLHARVYASPALAAERTRASASIQRVFRFYSEHPEELPEWRREEAAGEPLHHVIRDYIAGMTDGFLRRTETRLLGPQPG
jgi:dGTPase